mgnify:CR=1 FL=1
MNRTSSYRIVFFDIDGTLLNEEGRIPDSTREAIRRLRDSGVEVVLATGRAPAHLAPVARDLGIDSYVSLTGTFAVYRGQVIHDRPLPPSTVREVIAAGSENGDPLVLLGKTEVFGTHADHPHVVETFLQWLKLEVPPPLPPGPPDFPVYQFLLYTPAERVPQYEERFPELNIIRWHPLSLDMIPREASKASGVAAMLEHLGIPPEAAVAFGDALNDREMLSYVGMGIAMGNAHESLKPYARFVTDHIDNDGVWRALKRIGMI